MVIINSLEIMCIDKILLNNTPDDFKQFDSILKEHVLNRVLNPYEPKFSYHPSHPPAPSPKYISALVDETTTRLDLTLVPASVWFSYGSLSRSFPFAFLGDCKSLTHLSIRNQPNFGIAQLAPFLQTVGSQLTHLNLYGCISLADNSIHYISYYCRSLVSLEMPECIGVAGGVFQRAMSSNMSLLPIQGMERAAISNNSVHFSMLRMPLLRRLDLSGCKSIAPRNLYALASVFPSLESFSFAKVFLSDEDGARLVEGLPSTLLSLDISFNPIGKLTIANLVPSRNNLTKYNLKSINVGYCRCVTAIDVRNLYIGLYNTLESITLSGCVQIDKSLFDILFNKHNNDYSSSNISSSSSNNSPPQLLKTFDISYCTQFSAQSLHPLTGCRDEVQILSKTFKRISL